MIYPSFLNNKDLVGITAPSKGVGKKIDSFSLSIDNLSKYFKIVETNSVRNIGEVSNKPKIRGEEFNELLLNKDIKVIFCASGGDFCISSLEYIDFDLIKDNIKWIEGYSDPTSILYYITTKYDIATIYGNNAGSFDQTTLHKSLQYNIDLIKGNISKQKKFQLYEGERSENSDGYNLNKDIVYKNINGDVGFTRDNGARYELTIHKITMDDVNKFLENSNTRDGNAIEDYINSIVGKVNDLFTIIENAYKETLFKHGDMQACGAIKKYILYGETKHITNNNNARDNIKTINHSEVIDIIKSGLNVDVFCTNEELVDYFIQEMENKYLRNNVRRY